MRHNIYLFFLLGLSFFLLQCASDRPNTDTDAENTNTDTTASINSKRRISVQNYLTPIPLSELNDEVFSSFQPSLEETVFATKEFKERYDTIKEITKREMLAMQKKYREDTKKTKKELTESEEFAKKRFMETTENEVYVTARHTALYFAVAYFALPDLMMYEVDSLIARYCLTPNESDVYVPLGEAFVKFSAQRKTILKKEPDGKASAGYFTRIRKMNNSTITGFMTSQNVFLDIFLAEHVGYPQPPMNAAATATNKNNQDLYCYPPLPIVGCNRLELIGEEHSKANHISLSVIPKGISHIKPYVLVYVPSVQGFLQARYHPSNIAKSDNENVAHNNNIEYYLVSILPKLGTYYFLVLAKNEAGQMIGAIVPFEAKDKMPNKHSKLTIGIDDFFVTDYRDFERRVDALK